MRAAQVGLQRQAVALARAHRRLEHLDAVAADALGVIHRQLGVLQHVFLALRLPVGEREPDRRGEQDLAVVEGDRRAQRLADRVGERRDARRLALGEDQQAELVAAEPRQRILRLEQPAEAAREREQDRVADRHADGIVHLLEAVEIDHHHGRADGGVGRGERKRGIEPVEDTARGSAGR